MTADFNSFIDAVHEDDRNKKRHAGKIDSFIGEKVRNTRVLLGITQSQLAKKIGITFQQLQKYENGMNRVSAATIAVLSNVFNVSIGDFFPVYKINHKISTAQESKKSLSSVDNGAKEVALLLESYNNIKNEKTKKKILALVNQISEFN